MEVRSVNPPPKATINFGRYYFRSVRGEILLCMENDYQDHEQFYICSPDGEPCFPISKDEVTIRS